MGCHGPFADNAAHFLHWGMMGLARPFAAKSAKWGRSLRLSKRDLPCVA